MPHAFGRMQRCNISCLPRFQRIKGSSELVLGALACGGVPNLRCAIAGLRGTNRVMTYHMQRTTTPERKQSIPSLNWARCESRPQGGKVGFKGKVSSKVFLWIGGKDKATRRQEQVSRTMCQSMRATSKMAKTRCQQ